MKKSVVEIKTTTVKLIYDFDDEIDISYIKIDHTLASNEILEKVINKVNKKCSKGIFENDKCIYANEGHNANILLSYLKEEYMSIISTDIVVAFTVKDMDCIVAEPNFDLEMNLW